MKQRGKNRLRISYISSVISIATVLYMISITGILILYGNKLSHIIKENITVSIYLKNNASDEDVAKLKNTLTQRVYIKDLKYISKEQAATELSSELGEDFVEFLGYNPLPSSIDINLKSNYANSDSLVKIQSQLMQYSIVDDVVYQKILLDEVNSNLKKISLIILSFSAVLLIISIILISNTIKLSIYSKRFLIRSMQLVGATENFVRKPFLKQGIWQGIIASIIAIAFVLITFWFIDKKLGNIYELVKIAEILFFGIMVFLFGFIISMLATWKSVNKFLRMRVDKLYSN
ncbi:MAG: permease-like cell division protein FtsX [Lentimicrobiaceae bacterium]|nr:permease-like cell division protein FtsX [Lentimicrobiaceae bacterium]